MRWIVALFKWIGSFIALAIVAIVAYVFWLSGSTHEPTGVHRFENYRAVNGPILVFGGNRGTGLSIVKELRAAKTSRQFLFATHNANIPVFGDAEWIGVFTAVDNHGALSFDAQGSIDVPVIRDQVANILEGGRDAFNQRKEKYEF